VSASCPRPFTLGLGDTESPIANVVGAGADAAPRHALAPAFHGALPRIVLNALIGDVDELLRFLGGLLAHRSSRKQGSIATPSRAAVDRIGLVTP
jgi:hypothetical protein